MIEEIQNLIDNYVRWLKDKTVLRQVKDWVEITTPYLDRHNDYLQIYAKRQNGGYLLTDDGYVLEDLEQSGCKLESAKRQALLRITLNGFGVQTNEGRLEIHASPDNFALRKHNLIQAMLAVNDLFYLAVPVVASLFYEDVVAWLDLHEIRYTPKVKFTGKSGYDHLFDFVIPKSRTRPERILHTINRPSRDTAQVLAFSWIDTKEVRPPDSKAYALLNDSDQTISTSVLDALINYDVNPILWSRREEVRKELAA
jgi:hypothetical protein